MIFHTHGNTIGCQMFTIDVMTSYVFFLTQHHLQNITRSSCNSFYVKYLNKMQNENYMYFSLMHIFWGLAGAYDVITETCDVLERIWLRESFQGNLG